ncbi:MAG: hypothetical protein K2K85_03665 [Clostridia bacterium]|nr:hypothetical protein [Clostridia bacterium]
MSFIEEQIKKYEFQLKLLNSGFSTLVERREIDIIKNKNLLKIILDIIEDTQRSLDYYNKRLDEEDVAINLGEKRIGGSNG